MQQTATDATETRSLMLMTQDGARIDAQLDLIPGNAQLAEENLEDDGIELAWEASTEVDWDCQAPEYVFGEAKYRDDGHRNHFAGDLVVVETTTDEDGNERVTTRPYTGGIEPTLPTEYAAQLTPSGRNDRALKYARWIMGSLEQHSQGKLGDETLKRIHARAHEHAKREGAHETLERILASLSS